MSRVCCEPFIIEWMLPWNVGKLMTWTVQMPHVRKQEYKTPSKEYELEYVEVIQRHHKVLFFFFDSCSTFV